MSIDGVIVLLVILGGISLAGGWILDKQRVPTVGTRIDYGLFDPSLVNNVRYQIIPYLVSADRLPKTFEYTSFRFYSYLRSLLAGIVGIGVAPELLKYLNKVAQFDLAAPSPNTVPAPSGLGYVAVVLAALMIGFAVYSNQTSLAKRAVLADSCAAELRSLYAKLLKLSSGTISLSALDALSNEVSTIVLRHIAEKSWTFEHVLAPGIDSDVEAIANEILLRASRTPSNLLSQKALTSVQSSQFHSGIQQMEK